MIIDINNESITCDSFEIFETNLQRLLDLDSVEVWISEHGGPDDMPCMSILINDDKYVINYFGDDGINYVSSGNENDESS